jgi:hypothetical protein
VRPKLPIGSFIINAHIKSITYGAGVLVGFVSIVVILGCDCKS